MPLMGFMDIEASGIHPESYPIEVGFILTDGRSYCSLIKPVPSWSHWSEEAEGLHGITKDLLHQHGKSARLVAVELNQILERVTLYSDCWVLDSTWLTRLYEQAAMTPSFTLSDISYVLSEEQCAILAEEKQRALNDLNIERHRASNDARALWLAYQRLSNRGLKRDHYSGSIT